MVKFQEFFQANQIDDFDRYLPVLPLLINIDPMHINSSILFGPSLVSIWNKTNTSSIQNIIYRHPLLYGAAIYAFLLIIIGTIGNLLTIIILLRSNLRQYTTMRYLTAVAMADLCSLYSWNLNLFYKHLINPYQNDLEDSSIFACRLISYMAFVSLQLSSWYLTLVSLDRCLNIHFLFWNRQFGQAKYSVYIILTITILIFILNFHLLVFNGYKQTNCQPFGKRTCYVCYETKIDRYYIFPKWEKVHVIIYNFIPFSIMFISNSFIIYRSIITSKTKQSSTSQRRQRQLTMILILVTFLFVSFTTPVMIYNVFLRNYLKDRKPLKYIVLGILQCIQFTSHAINFFIYCYGASKFRQELKIFFSLFIKQHRSLHERTRSSLQNP